MGKILIARQDGVHALKFVGDVRLDLGPTLATYLDELNRCENFQSVIIDLSQTEAIDSTSLGMIAKIAINLKEQHNAVATIISPNPDITRLLESMALEQVCVLLAEPEVEDSEMLELPREICSETELCQQIIEAHRTLMGLTEENFENFKDLVEALENENQEPKRTAHG